MIVHISRLGTLIDTGCERPENLEAYARMVLPSPAASRGRISRLRILCSFILAMFDVPVGYDNLRLGTEPTVQLPPNP